VIDVPDPNSGTYRILADVTRNGYQMFIVLNRKTLEASLPYMSAAAIVLVIATHVAG